MNGNTESGFARQESIARDHHVTAAVRRTERGELFTEYEVGDRTFQGVDELEAALRGEQL